MDPTLKAALAMPTVTLFCALKIEFPSYTLRLLDGSGVVVIDGDVYAGVDDTFGTIESMSELNEEIGNQAPEISLTLFPPDVSGAATLSNPAMQGSAVTLMVGALDPVTGSVLGTPEIVFLGEVDVPTVEIDANGSRTVSYTIVSVFERLFEVEEGQRASDGWHQSIWPGELGLEFMTGTDVNLYWGATPPKSAVTAKGLDAARAAVLAGMARKW